MEINYLTGDFNQLNQLIESLLNYIRQIGLQNNKVSIGITLEAIIQQNQFILSLWQTFITAHFAIFAGLFTNRKPINTKLAVFLGCAYTLGIMVNGFSLYDAYKALEALQDDIFQSLLEISGTQNSNIHLSETKIYFKENKGFPYQRAMAIPFLFLMTWIASVHGLYTHTIYHRKNMITKKQNFVISRRPRRYVRR